MTDLSMDSDSSELTELESDDDLSDPEGLVSAFEDVVMGEAEQGQSAAASVAPPVPSNTEKLGIVVQTSFNVAHFGDKIDLTRMEELFNPDFDPDVLPPEGDANAAKIYKLQLAIYEALRKDAKKKMKIEAILTALRGAELNGHPIDIASFHEVNNIKEFLAQLQERDDAFGLEITEQSVTPSTGAEDDHEQSNEDVEMASGSSEPSPPIHYVMVPGPLMITGTTKNNQKEHYPIIYNADKFELDKVSYIPTHGPNRGQVLDVPASGNIWPGKGKSRPLIVYTLTSKENPGAPPLNVAVVHTKPIGGGMNFEGGKDRRAIFEQVRKAYETAKSDADTTGALWTFIGDHYLANNDLANDDEGKISVGEMVDDMGLTAIDPVPNTNTMEKIDRALHEKNILPETEASTGKGGHVLRPRHPDEDLKDKKVLPSNPKEDRSEASFLDRNMAQVADKAVVTQNLTVAQGGIVPPRLPGNVAVSSEMLTAMNAGQFFASDEDNQELARILLVSDHSMFVLVTSDDPDDEQRVNDMFQHHLDDAEDLAESIDAEDHSMSDEDSEDESSEDEDSEDEGSEAESYEPSSGSDSEDEAGRAELAEQRRQSMSVYQGAPPSGGQKRGRTSNEAGDESEDGEDGEGGEESEESEESEGGSPNPKRPRGFRHTPSASDGRSITLPVRSARRGSSHASSSGIGRGRALTGGRR